jgi:hypothetical protein
MECVRLIMIENEAGGQGPVVAFWVSMKESYYESHTNELDSMCRIALVFLITISCCSVCSRWPMIVQLSRGRWSALTALWSCSIGSPRFQYFLFHPREDSGRPQSFG